MTVDCSPGSSEEPFAYCNIFSDKDGAKKILPQYLHWDSLPYGSELPNQEQPWRSYPSETWRNVAERAVAAVSMEISSLFFKVNQSMNKFLWLFYPECMSLGE